MPARRGGSGDEDHSLSETEGPCSDTHFIPILDEIRARPDPEAPAEGAEPISENLRQSAPALSPAEGAKAHPGWGGRRPGAGAPKGNTNAFKDGRHSSFYQRAFAMLADMPEVREALIAIGKRRPLQQRLAEASAAEILAGLLQRAGEIVLHPENNHLENNQLLLDFLRRMEAQLKVLSKMQSREARKIQGSIKRDPAARNQRRGAS
jgi:hypothetical protein